MLTSMVAPALALSPGVFTPGPLIYLNCEDNDSCVLYVDRDNGTVGPHQGTKADPFTTISDALSLARSNDDYRYIRIAEGTYSDASETFPLDVDMADFSHAIYLDGGWNGLADDWAERDPAANATIIDASGNTTAIQYNGIGGGVSGLRIHGVSAGLGAAYGVNVDLTTGSATTMTVSENTIYDITGFGGAAVRILAGSSTATANDNTMYNVSTLGGPFWLEGDIEAYNNVLHDNTGVNVVYCTDGAHLYNNVMVENTPFRVVHAAGDCTVQHNSIVRNELQDPGTDFGAVVMEGGANVVSNNLITHNTGNDSSRHLGGDTSTFEYNGLYGNTADPEAGTDNNLVCDPNYAVSSGTDADDVMLNDASDCVDTGKNIATITTDFNGVTRPADGDDDGDAKSDPGAHEVPAPMVDAPVISNLDVLVDPFSPDGDGTQDSTTLGFSLNTEADVTVEVKTSTDTPVVTLATSETKNGSVSYGWDGKGAGNTDLEEGMYKFVVMATNTGGSDTQEVSVEISYDEAPAPGGQCAGYTDVSASHSSCDAIEYVQSIGAMTGNPDGTFAPNELLQRDQVAKISLETFGLFNDTEDYCNGTDPFPDVPPAQWSYQYICRGVDVGMITGYEGGADAGFYRPARQVNRVEFLALILRNLSDTMPADSSTSYSDVEANQWFSGYARYSLDNDLFAGPNLMPTNGTKRVEVADVLYKLHNAGKI